MTTKKHGVLGIVGTSAGGVEALRTGLVEPALARGWRVAVTLTPTAGRWLRISGETDRLEKLTGLPVRDEPRLPGEARPHPSVDCYVVAPASANTVAKLATGIADNQALTQVGGSHRDPRAAGRRLPPSQCCPCAPSCLEVAHRRPAGGQRSPRIRRRHLAAVRAARGALWTRSTVGGSTGTRSIELQNDGLSSCLIYVNRGPGQSVRVLCSRTMEACCHVGDVRAAKGGSTSRPERVCPD